MPPAKHPVPSWIRRGHLRWVWALWEPRALYQRSAHMAPYSPGNAHWMQDWYRRMHSEEMVERLAEMGVNVVSSHFYKGFGVRAEAEEMELAARFTETCHAFGIRVLGYHQWATICYETFLDEVPHAEQWIQRDADGRKLLYGRSVYWRWFGCQRHEEYVQYLRDVVRRCVTEAKMDGVEWDGTVYMCHCDKCQAAFREYLERKYADVDPRELFGLPHFRNVRIPATEVGQDPLYQELVEFRREFMFERLADFNGLIKSLNPEAAHVTYGLAPPPVTPFDDIDLVVYEHHDFPFVADGVLTSQMRGVKECFAQDRVALCTGWLRAPSQRGETNATLDNAAEVAAFGAPVGGLRRPETGAEVKRDLADMTLHGAGMVCPTWALRPTGGDKAAFEDPALEPALRQYLDFFRRREALFENVESLANVAVYRSRASQTLDYFDSFPCAAGMEQVCLQSQIPFDTLHTHQLDRLERYDAVLLAEQACLSDAEVAAFRAHAEAGRGLVITGRTGVYDERYRMRREHPFRDLFDSPRVVFLPDTPERLSQPERNHPPAYHDFRLPERADEIARAIRAATGGSLPVEVEANPFVGVHVYRVASGERVIHLLNYDNEAGTTGVAVALPDAPPSVRLVTPDADPEEREAPVEDRIVIPDLETYALLVIPA